MFRTVGSVVEVGSLVAAVRDWRESVVRVHDGFDEYLVSFGALSASRRSLLVLTTNEGRQLAGPRAGISSLGLGSFACPRDGKNNVISQNETLRRRDHPIDVGGCTARGQREALGPCCNDPSVQHREH
jgi:hypothetical protein